MIPPAVHLPMKVYIETFGCQMNRLDSELAGDLLRGRGFEPTADRDEADVIVYNTCSVRAHAEQKVFSRLGRDARRKAVLAAATPPRAVMVGVIGCMAQRLGRKLRGRFEAVDFVCAPGRIHELPDIIEAAAAADGAVRLNPPRTAPADGGAGKGLEQLDAGRVPPSSRHAYLRIVRGCDRFCSYCIVPFVRGPEISRTPASVLDEARKLVDAGCDYLTLLGQRVNNYRHRGRTTTAFADLLGMLAGVRGLRRLDFITSHPVGFDRDVLVAMRDLDPLGPYIHCPPQSGSDRILKAMNRGYTRADYDALVDTARGIVPGVTIAGDFITGFPGETEEDHLQSIDLIRRSGFKNSFIFKYSPRPGTAAAKRFRDDVTEAVKKRRNNELLTVQKEVGLACHRSCIGKRYTVYVEGPSPRYDRQDRPPTPDATQMAGRTAANHIVLFYGSEETAGEYVEVEITGAMELALTGRPVKQQ